MHLPGVKPPHPRKPEKKEVKVSEKSSRTKFVDYVKKHKFGLLALGFAITAAIFAYAKNYDVSAALAVIAILFLTIQVNR